MSSHSRFLRLPRELRDIIYEYYALDEGNGYHFDPSSCKFKTSNGSPINLSLMYTCKLVAAEMHGVPLGTNTLIFSTMCLEDGDFTATRFHWALNGLFNEKGQQLTRAQRHVTSDIEDKVARKYPSFIRPFNNRGLPFGIDGTGREISCWGEPSSIYRGFVDYTLHLLWTHRHSLFLEAPRNYFGKVDPIRLGRLLALNPSPWAIPSENEVADMEKTVHFPHALFFDVKDEYFQTNCIKHRFSAAAVAIRFFESTPPNTLIQIRKVLLCEDQESVAYPASHAAGLIGLYLAYPKIHIERRVSVFRNMLPAGSDKDHRFLLYRIADLDRDNHSQGNEQLQSFYISSPFSVWIEETLGLYDAGMPLDSFSLVFDDDGAPDLSSEVFAIVKRDAAWQEALDKWIEQKSLNPTFQQRRTHSCYKSERFPQAIRRMSDGTSPIRCNFPIAGLWDVQQVLDENRANETLEDWEINWDRKLYPQTFQTTAPLPSWRELRLDKVIPEKERWPFA